MCPRPIQGKNTAAECIAAGYCGCDERVITSEPRLGATEAGIIIANNLRMRTALRRIAIGACRHIGMKYEEIERIALEALAPAAGGSLRAEPSKEGSVPSTVGAINAEMKDVLTFQTEETNLAAQIEYARQQVESWPESVRQAMSIVGEKAVTSMRQAYWKTHEPPHCPSCSCGPLCVCPNGSPDGPLGFNNKCPIHGVSGS